MIPVKIQCGCGQKYAFDVEPVNGRMPGPVACPICGADGTTAANQLIAHTLSINPAAAPPPPPPAPVPAPSPTMLRPASASTLAPPPTPFRPASQLGRNRDEDEGGPGGPGDNWKWYYYVLAGIGIGGYSIWDAYNKESIKPLGSLFLAVFCILIGVWDFNRKRKKKRAQG